MESTEPHSQPFGYTFDTLEHDIFQNTPDTLSNGGQTLLNDSENRTLLDFFSNTNYFYAADAHASITPVQDTKNSLDSFDWGVLPPPASVHQVSTIADQSQLHRGFHTEHALHPEHHQQSFSVAPYPTNIDHSHHTVTLYNTDPVQPHVSHPSSNPNPRSYSVPNLQHNLSISNPVASNVPTGGFGNMPMVHTPHGMMHEQLAALIPNHSENGSIDEQLAAQFSNAQVDIDPPRPSLKRAYTYGTDSAFNATGYVGPPLDNEDTMMHQHLVHGLGIAQPMLGAVNGDDSLSPTGQFAFPLADGLQEDSHDDNPSLNGTSGDERGHTKKRRKTKTSPIKEEGISGSRRKSTSAVRQGKIRKMSVDENPGKKKRHSPAGPKSQRENLSEEQKRSNHIISEQKRRNLIKRGFDDLHQLVPDIHSGGLSKSAVLTETANFLDSIILANNKYSQPYGPTRS
ncbi:hypothetical protein B0J11DRAFT_332629 [Dendryphion nanum]|uniref:BHLH domain-containing protein n=1 Tax=Dendryphion nanum TaxID=256645 RepID=A0A9P9IHG8_9PLEO|nr:hypothetical protein B0J11DRAFT_332629 [Dendryphion nanum]